VNDVIEEFKWSRPVFKRGKDFAYLQANKNHVNLGFYRNIEQLKDPENVLEGTGKMMRHIKIKTSDEINADLLSGWIIAAAS
jgi:hypothetical protein